jgi:hypothetical protein
LVFEELKFLRFIVDSKIYVAFAAACWTLETFTPSPNHIIYPVLVFVWVWLAYQFLNEHTYPGFRAQRVLFLIVGIADVWWMSWTGRLLMLGLFLLVLTYKKVEGLNWQRLHWRRIPLIKNAMIACCWIILPLATSRVSIPEHSAPWLAWLIHQWMIIAVLSMLEDYCHSAHDSTPTGATRYRPVVIRSILVMIPLCSAIPLLVATKDVTRVLPIVLVVFVIASLPFFIRSIRNSTRQSILIDGMIILHAAAVLVGAYA